MILLISTIILQEEFLIELNLSEIYFSWGVNLATYRIITCLSVKRTCQHLWDTSVWLVFRWTELTDLKLCILCVQACAICFHPTVHTMFPQSNGTELHRLHCQWHVGLQCVESPIAVVPEILLDLPPEIFNEVKFTMELWEEDAEMASIFDDFCDNGWMASLYNEGKMALDSACPFCLQTTWTTDECCLLRL